MAQLPPNPAPLWGKGQYERGPIARPLLPSRREKKGVSVGLYKAVEIFEMETREGDRFGGRAPDAYSIRGHTIALTVLPNITWTMPKVLSWFQRPLGGALNWLSGTACAPYARRRKWVRRSFISFIRWRENILTRDGVKLREGNTFRGGSTVPMYYVFWPIPRILPPN